MRLNNLILTLVTAVLILPSAKGNGLILPGEFNSSVEGWMTIKPDRPFVGERFFLEVTLTISRGVTLENILINEILNDKTDPIMYEPAENLPDGVSIDGTNVVKRFRLPARITAPVNCVMHPVISGMIGIRHQSLNSSSYVSRNFSAKLGTLRIETRNIPNDGRPADFSGAIGHDFRLSQEISKDKVSLGDIITATYTLTFDGVVPTNALVVTTKSPSTLKMYDVKEAMRIPNKIVWTQALVSDSSSATNTPRVLFSFFDTVRGCYSETSAEPRSLTFVSTPSIITSNTVITVDAPSTVGVSRVLRFAPSKESPIIAILPPNADVLEVERRGGWRRVEGDVAAGWEIE